MSPPPWATRCALQARTRRSASSLKAPKRSSISASGRFNTPLSAGFETGSNPRQVEKDQIVRLMSIFAETFFVGNWDLELGGRKLEDRILKGEPIPLMHLRAWRIARAHILGTLGDKIELNRRVNETLEAMARALFKSWFVDFKRIAIGKSVAIPARRIRAVPCRSCARASLMSLFSPGDDGSVVPGFARMA